MKVVVSFLLFLIFHSIPVLSDESEYNSNTHSFEYYIDSFSKAKRLLLKLYSDHQSTFYCQCEFDGRKNVSSEACGYAVRKNQRRGRRIEWEHVVPAHRFGGHRTCWKEPGSFSRCIKTNGKTLSGRKCCRKVDLQFKEMEADMRNLVPTVGELNADRSNYSFGIIEGENRNYGQCDFEVDTKKRRAEPAVSLRGNIARIYYYFQTKYGLLLTDSEKNYFSEWNNLDPVDDWELEKERRVNQILLSVGKRRNTSPVFVEAN